MKNCIRFFLVFNFFSVASLVAAADTTAKNLERAKAEYETEMIEIRKLVVETLDQQEEIARKSGNKLLLDWTEAEAEQFEKLGALPQSRSANLQKNFDRVHNKLEAAFNTAIKEYTKTKRDSEAASTLDDLRKFRLSRMIAGFHFKGTWKTNHDDSGWNTTFSVDGPNVVFSFDKRPMTWSREGASVTIHYPDGASETVTLNVDSPNNLRGVNSRGSQLSWVRLK